MTAHSPRTSTQGGLCCQAWLTLVCVWGGGLCTVGSLAPPWPPPTRCSTAPPGVTTKHSLGVRVALTENQGTGKYAHNFLPVALSLWILFLAHVVLSGTAGWKGTDALLAVLTALLAQ